MSEPIRAGIPIGGHGALEGNEPPALPYDRDLAHRGGRLATVALALPVETISTLAEASESDAASVLLAGFLALVRRYDFDRADPIAVQRIHGDTAARLLVDVDSGQSLVAILDQLAQAVDTPGSVASLALVVEPADQPSPAGGNLVSHDATVLRLRVSPTFGSDGLSHLDYDEAMFDETTALRMAGHLSALLQGAARDLSSTVERLPLLTPTEAESLARWPTHQPDPAPATTLHGRFHEMASTYPESVAVRYADHTLTYRQLAENSNQLAHALVGKGVAPGDRVVLIFETGPDLITAMLATLATGATMVCLDPTYPSGRLAAMVPDIDTAMVIGDPPSVDAHADIFSAPDIARVVIGTAGDSIAEGWTHLAPTELIELPISLPDIETDPAASCYIAYTSGSTGAPKGIVQSHGAFTQFLDWQSRELSIVAGDRWAQWASIAYDASYCEIFGALTCGATLLLADGTTRYNPPTLVEWAHREHATILQLVPSFAREVVGVMEGENALWPQLRLLMVAGERFPVDLARRWLRLADGQVNLYNLYGPSESVLATHHRVTPADLTRSSIPIGRAIDGRHILILDPRGRLVPLGVKGELYIRSRFLTDGYFRDATETDRRFTQSPLHDDYPDPVFRTGDIARWTNGGFLEFFGRNDDLVKLRGVRVELGDVETAIRGFSSVEEAAAAVRTPRAPERKLVAKEWEARDAEAGNDQMLVGYFSATAAIDTAALRDHLERRLPIHLVPQHLVQLEELPLNANHKIDLRRLPEINLSQLERTIPFVTPSGPTEATVARVWSSVLGVDDVGAKDGFFDLGGDSLRAMQVLNRLAAETDVRLTSRDLFTYRTVTDLATAIDSAGTTTGSHSDPETPQVGPEGEHPLTLAQQGIWFLWRLEPDNPFYTAQGSIRLEGPLDVAALRRAWSHLIERHEVLRSRFGLSDGQAVQMFRDDMPTDLPLVDLGDLSITAGREAMATATAERVRALDLERDPLFEGELFRLADEEHEIAVTFHEIVLDVWGLSILMEDLERLYGLEVSDSGDVSAPSPARFGEYALWESVTLTRDRLNDQGQYWRDQLDGELPIVALPTDRARPATPTYRGAGESLTLDEATSKALRRLSRDHDVTLFATLLAGLSLVIHAYSGQDEVVIGAPIANRTHVPADEIVGFFLNMLPFRVRHDPAVTFAELLGQVGTLVTDALSNSDYPFPWMAESVRTQRDRSVSPVFQIMFNMLNLPHAALDGDQLSITFSELDSGFAKYDLSLYAQEHGRRIFLQFVYLTDLFESTTVRRMLDNLEVLLTDAAANPHRPVGELQAMSDEERHQMLDVLNATTVDYEIEPSIDEFFHAALDRHPHAIAYRHRGETITYQQLADRAGQVARWLGDQGVGLGKRVAVCTDRSCDMPTAILGTLYAGAAYVALDPEYPTHRLDLIIDESEPSVLISSAGLDRLDVFDGPRLDLSTVDGSQRNDLQPWPERDRPLAIVYTSSTTGRPKGVTISHRSVVNRLQWMWHEYPFLQDDVAVVQKSPALVAVTWELFGALLKGVPTLLLDVDDVRDPARLWNQCVRHGVTHFLGVPALLEGVLLEAERNSEPWSSLRLATTSAEPISPDMVRRWQAQFRDVPLLNLYGSTECSSNALGYDTARLLGTDRRVPVGTPLPNVRAYVLDGGQRPVPWGATGELCIGGECLATGYLHEEELTADAFIPDPFQSGATLYRTGDLARIRHDGEIELVGRSDLQVKVRGFRVELGDIESALLAHPDVTRCAAMLDDRDIERPRLVALVEAGDWTTADLRTHLDDRLPSYMIPAQIMEVPELPLTPSGKIHREALRLPTGDTVSDRLHVPPRDAVEADLVGIWEEVLGVSPIGVTDDFFELGGHSLLAVRMMDQIGKVLRQSLPIALLFQAPTVEGVADRIREMEEEPRHANAWETVVPIQKGGDRVPFFCIHDGAGGVFHFNYLARQMGRDLPFYGLQPQAWDFGRAGAPTIEGMAQHYIDAIRSVQAHGPFMIGGFCFGGIVALEVAQRLKAAGEEVGVLALIEPSRIAGGRGGDEPGAPAGSAASGRFARLKSKVKSKFVYAHGAELIDPDKVGTYRSPLEVVKLFRVALQVRFKRLVCRAYLLASRPIPRRYRNFYFKTEVSRRAGIRYKARPYDGTIDLFLARRHGLDWERLATGGTTIHKVPADETGHTPTHLEMLRDPWIEHVAQPLRAAIDTASGDGHLDR